MLFSLRRAILVRIFQWLYEPFAWSYDAVSTMVSMGRWRVWGQAALEFTPGPRVLELGHGPGHLMVALSRGGWQPVGLDLSFQMGKLARQRLVGHGLAVNLVRGRGEALPLVSGCFNGIVATFPAPYILMPETIAELRRVLRPDGRLVIVPEAILTGGGLLGRVIEWLYVITAQRSAPRAPDLDRNDIWIRALGGAGFQVEAHQVQQEGSMVTVIVAEKVEIGIGSNLHRPLESA